ncbi:hypothetical protein BGZ51_007521 [Haplosporangium sp. Z 767]|nr:hypothetical protein BGZ51_007521 [Haplosporangium sp. Z 767]KAF9194398.1 hypothetical protein BGZ50_006314 [Haplosporangium sp. Z 11]
MSTIENRYLAPSFKGLLTQIGLTAGISIVCIGVFEWNRRKKTMQYLYSPRCRLTVNPSPPVSMKFLGWIKPTINISEEFYIANVGLDAVMFLRFLKMCLQFCIFNGVLGGIILLPIHYTASDLTTEVRKFSIQNVPPDSNTLWAHVFLTYMVTISWMFLLFKNYWQWMDLRREYTLQRIRQGEIAERSVFISRLPSNLRSDAALKQYFESLKMGPVESATVVQHCGRLSQKIDRRESTLNMLEKAHIELAKEVLESVKHGRFLYNPSSPALTSTAAATQQRPLLQNSTSKTETTSGIQSIDISDLEKLVQELYKDKKLFHKVRKSIFAHKRDAVVPPTTMPPQLNIPLSALSRHSDTVDVYVHGSDKEAGEKQEMGSSLSMNPPPVTIWNVLQALDRKAFDRFQPTRPENRLKGGSRVPSIDYLVKKYNKLDRRVGELRDGSLRYKSTSYGFVTFKHHLSAQLCAQAKIDSRPQGLNVNLAMEPRDVLWSNLTASFRNRLTRSVVVNLSIWVLTIFWIFPTTSFLLLTSLGELSSKFEFLQPILQASPLIQSLLQNILPIVFVTIFLAFAPVIILEISKQELPLSHSALEGNVFRRYYHFLIFNVLFVFMIGTAILKSIIALIQTPTNVFTLLADKMPEGSTFFVFYIIFNTCTHALELAQIWAQLVIHSFVTARKLTPTPRALQRAMTPWCFQYYYYYPQNIVAMVITIIYSVISPLILIAGIPYFAFALLVFKYQFAYCYIRKYENGGKFFRHVFQYTSDGLIIFQITMVGVLWLKEALVGGFVVVVLIGMTIYFKILCGDLFKSRTKYLPLDTGLRNFDNDSAYAMNEMPMSDDEISAHSSAVVDSQAGLRRRSHVAKAMEGEEIDNIHEKATADENDKSFAQSDSREKFSMEAPYSTLSTDVTGSQSTKHGYDTGSSRLNMGISGLMDDMKNMAKGSKHQSRNSLSLRIHTKDVIESLALSPDSNMSPTRDIKLFTVKDEPIQRNGAVATTAAAATVHDDNVVEDESYSAGFLDEDGFYLENFGKRNSGMACRPLASHFDHTPSKLAYQDRTSDFETYIHPALLKSLNRKLWLPRNPLFEHWDLDDTVEIDFSLNSSATMDTVEFRVRDKEDELSSGSRHEKDYHSGHHQRFYSQRKNTTGSNFDNGAGGTLQSPSNWQGCLSDSPPSTAAPVSGVGSQWDKYDEIPNSSINATTPGNRIRARAEHHGNQGQNVVVSDYDVTTLAASPRSAQMSHSASMTSMRAFSPTSPQSGLLSPHLITGEYHSGGISSNNTRYKRSASMPPAPLLPGELADGMNTAPSFSPQPIPSPFLNVRQHHPHHHHHHQHRSHRPSSPSSVNQSPRVSFVQDATSTASAGGAAKTNVITPLMVRSTMFAGPVLRRQTISHGLGTNIQGHPNHLQGQSQHQNRPRDPMQRYGASPLLTAAGTGTGIGSGNGALSTLPSVGIGSNNGTAASRKSSAGRSRGAAGAFFNMIFGDFDDDVLDAHEKTRFGYEIGGMWSSRRASIDRHDDDDDDDDDDGDACPEPTSVHASAPAHTTINMSDGHGSGTAPIEAAVGQGAEGAGGMVEVPLTLTPPSHLDLSEASTAAEAKKQKQ